MAPRTSSKHVVLLVAFAVVGTALFYVAGEATGGSGPGSAAIFLAILAIFVVVKAFGSRSTTSASTRDE